jgi:predicted nucleic acid-binding protein
MVGEDIAIQAAVNDRTLRALGITVCKTIDVLICTFCIENGMPLLHADRDFEPMERHLGLVVARP